MMSGRHGSRAGIKRSSRVNHASKRVGKAKRRSSPRPTPARGVGSVAPRRTTGSSSTRSPDVSSLGAHGSCELPLPVTTTPRARRDAAADRGAERVAPPAHRLAGSGTRRRGSSRTVARARAPHLDPSPATLDATVSGSRAASDRKRRLAALTLLHRSREPSLRIWNRTIAGVRAALHCRGSGGIILDAFDASRCRGTPPNDPRR